MSLTHRVRLEGGFPELRLYYVMIPVWIVLPAVTINVFLSMIDYKY